MSGIGGNRSETERSLQPLDKNPLRAPTIFCTLRSSLAPRSAPLTCSEMRCYECGAIHLIPLRPLLIIRFSAFCHPTSVKLETAHPVTLRLFIASYNCVEMAKNVNAVNVINWEHSENFLRRSDGLKLSHPSSLLTWVHDMKKWPEVTYGDIFNYFVLSEGVNGVAITFF